MIKREEVEALLREMRDANQWRQHQGKWAPSAAFVQDHAARIEELARTWLAVDEAPVGRTVARDESWKRGGQTGVQIELDGVVPVGLLQRVRLVPEADSGGDRG